MVVSVRGVAFGADTLSTVVKVAIRDAGVSRRKGEVEAADNLAGGHCYYLRSARKCHVDHTFECQLMGHALVQTPSWHGLYAQEGFIDGKISTAGE